MNERFKELRRQATLVEKYTSHDGSVHEGKSVDLEKFAELIVRECMNICKDHPSRVVSNNWNADAVAPHLVQQFEEHFGVEE